jgi:hypothetical protein
MTSLDQQEDGVVRLFVRLPAAGQRRLTRVLVTHEGKPFSGWLGLIGVLDGLLSTYGSAGEEPTGSAARSIPDLRARADRDGNRGGQQP